MKKLKMQPIIKIIIIFILVSLSIILFILQFYESKNYTIVEKENKLYSYKISPNIKYNVNLFDNNIFDNNSLPQGGTYISSLVDKIDLNISSALSGNKKSRISGKYNITATIKGNISSQNEPKTLWSKRIILRDDTNFVTMGNDKEITENLSIDYNWYSNMVKEVNESINVSTTNILEIAMNVEYDIDTDHGKIKETANPTIIIPIGSNYFTLNSSNTNEKIGDIKKTDKLTLNPDFKIITLYRILIGIILIVLILLLIFTTNPSEYDIYVKKINNIFKNYSKLLVGIVSFNNLNCDNIYYVKSFDDLVKISDEIEKPIFYNDSKNIENISEFYIINMNSIYIYYIESPESIALKDDFENSENLEHSETT